VLSLLGELLVDIANPFFDALEVHGDAAASAGPDPLFSFNLLRADDASHVVTTALSLNKPRGLKILAPLIIFLLLGQILRFVLGGVMILFGD